MTPIIGHEAQQHQLQKALAAGKLHHAIIFAGQRGIGKASFAHEFAARMVDPDGAYSALLRAGTHPDSITVERLFKHVLEEGQTRHPDDELKRSVGVDQIRRLQATLSQNPAMSKNRVIIIDSIDEFEKSSSNALLKLLEEPPSGSHFFLISHSSDRLLPTVRSRCQILHFDRLTDQQSAQIVEREAPDLTGEERAALVRAGQGSPGQALEFAGLDIGEIERQARAIIDGGDRDNAIRLAMAAKLSLKHAGKRYEAFLRRVPAIIADHARQLSAESALPAVETWHRASELAARATGLSLDKKSVVVEMGSLLAGLNAHKQAA